MSSVCSSRFVPRQPGGPLCLGQARPPRHAQRDTQRDARTGRQSRLQVVRGGAPRGRLRGRVCEAPARRGRGAGPGLRGRVGGRVRGGAGAQTGRGGAEWGRGLGLRGRPWLVRVVCVRGDVRRVRVGLGRGRGRCVGGLALSRGGRCGRGASPGCGCRLREPRFARGRVHEREAGGQREEEGVL
jgi:hypothetical protein